MEDCGWSLLSGNAFCLLASYLTTNASITLSLSDAAPVTCATAGKMASLKVALNHFSKSGDAWTGRSVVGTAKCLAVVHPSVLEAWASASSIAVAHASEETTLFEDQTLTPPFETVSNVNVLDEHVPQW